MALVCNECKKTVEDFSPYNRVFEKYHEVSVFKKSWRGLLISDFSYLICEGEHSKIVNSLVSTPNQIKDKLFLGVKDNQNYQFFGFDIAKELLPVTSKYFEAGLEKITFVNANRLQKKNSKFLKKFFNS